VPDGQIKTRFAELHGRSLSRRRRGWRGGADRDGASYRVHVSCRPVFYREWPYFGQYRAAAGIRRLFAFYA
jgi:hypothetical protein